MTCNRCRKHFAAEQPRCPHCGQPNPDPTGMFQTSTVLISTGEADLIYRSVEEVPAPLRSRLLESTNGANSGTILIADQRGRKQIARAMRKLPGLGRTRRRGTVWLTPQRRKLALAFLLMFALAIIGLVFGHRW